MAPVVPFIPAIASGVMGLFGAKSQANASNKAADAENAMVGKLGGVADQQSALARNMSGFAADSFSASKPALSKAMQYYSTLAGGNRGAIDATLAPARAGVTDTASGSARAIDATMAPGAQRDQALFRLQQQKQGQLGLMPFQAQTDAVSKLGTMGESAADRGVRLASGADSALNGVGNTYRTSAGLLENAVGNQKDASNVWSNFGSSMFNQFGPQLLGLAAGKKNTTLPARQTTMNNTGYMPGGGF